jgi:membrane protein
MAMSNTQVRGTKAFRERSRATANRFRSTAIVAGKEFIESDPMNQAAAIAYYTIISLPAVMIITVMAAATFYDEASVRAAILDQAGRLVGPETAGSLEDVLKNARMADTRLLAKVLGITALLISSGTVFASLQSTLNHVWKVKAKPGRAIFKYLGTRLLSLALVASFGFVMLVSLVLDAMLVAFGERLSIWMSGSTARFVATVEVALSFAVVASIFAMIFKVLPDARVRWRDVWGGAVLTALLFSMGKFLIGLYIKHAGVGDTYGAAGAMVIILAWVYYSTVILIYGAHFTHVQARDHGEGVVPSSHAAVDHAA